MEKKMDTTIVHWGYMGFRFEGFGFGIAGVRGLGA